MTDSPASIAAALLDDQVPSGGAQHASDLAEGVVPARTDRLPLARFYMTSDLRAATGLPRTHLDYYLREGLILPTARTESGYLLFDDNELATLRTIIAQRQAGVAIREIRRRLGR